MTGISYDPLLQILRIAVPELQSVVTVILDERVCATFDHHWRTDDVWRIALEKHQLEQTRELVVTDTNGAVLVRMDVATLLARSTDLQLPGAAIDAWLDDVLRPDPDALRARIDGQADWNQLAARDFRGFVEALFLLLLDRLPDERASHFYVERFGPKCDVEGAMKRILGSAEFAQGYRLRPERLVTMSAEVAATLAISVLEPGGGGHV